MGHFGEIRLADPVFSAVVLPIYTNVSYLHENQELEGKKWNKTILL